MKDVFTSADRELLNRVSALLDRGAPSNQHSPDAQNVRLTIFQSAHGFVAKDPIYFDATGSASWKKALATNTTATKAPRGIVESVGTNSFTVVLQGMIRGLSGLTAGTLYYLADAGGLTSTAPAFAIPMLKALTTTSGIVLSAAASAASLQAIGADADNSSASSISVSGLTGLITKPFAVNVSAWARSSTLSGYGEGLTGRFLVYWTPNVWTYQSSGIVFPIGSSGNCVADFGGNKIGPRAFSFMSATLSLTGGAGGDYAAITNVTLTLALNPNQDLSGCALAIEGIQ